MRLTRTLNISKIVILSIVIILLIFQESYHVESKPFGSELQLLSDKDSLAQNVTKNIGKTIYSYYFGENGKQKNDGDEILIDSCLLGTSFDYLTWLETDCHLRPTFGLSKNSLLDLSHSNWTEAEANAYLQRYFLPDSKHKQVGTLFSVLMSNHTHKKM